MWIFTTLLILIPQALAGDVPVKLLSEDITIEEVISHSVSNAQADIKGKGDAMQLTYSVQEPLTVFVAFRKKDGAFSVFNTIQTILPAGIKQEATIDLTISPQWSIGENSFRLFFFSDSKQGAIFHDIEFIDATTGKTLSTAAKHLTMIQPYSPASYHRFPGLRVLGIPMVPVIGIAMLLAVLLLLILKKKHLLFPFIIIVALACHARFSLDALYYSWIHTNEWLRNNTYATAGSLPAIAKDLLAEDASSAYLCHTGTTYAKKLLQYHAFPVLITGGTPSHIVVHRSIDWSYNDSVLRCDGQEFSANLLETYNDGSALYQAQK